MPPIRTSLAGGGTGAGPSTAWSRSACPVLFAFGCSVALSVPSAPSGRTTRSGYDFVGAAQAAGILHGGWAHLLGWSLLAVPVLAGFCGAAAVLRAYRASVAFCGLAGLVTLAFSASLFVKLPGAALPGRWAGAVLGAAAVVTTLHYLAQGSPSHAR